MRVLYHVAVFRSKAQARALQQTLHTNPDLGRFIKMLRVEGGFSPAMHEILDKSPNISDLFLSLLIHAPGSTGGLVSGLSLINPTRMSIFDHSGKQLRNKQNVQRLAVPYLYRHLAFPRWGPLRGLSLQLASTPAVGEHIRSIAIRRDPFQDNVDLRLMSMSPTLPWTTFEALGQTAGPNLQEFSGFKLEAAGSGVPHSPAVFGCFPVLRTLDWTVDHGFMPAAPLFDRAAVVPTDALPVLESLRVGSAAGIDVFVKMDLPRLRRVDLDIDAYRDPAFLQKHGAKLEELKLKETDFRGTSILTLCPRISTLSCTVHPQSGSDLGCNRLAPGFQHACLATLTVDKEALATKVKDAEDWKLFFDRVDLAHFPLLNDIRVTAIHEWPTTEHAISKSIWV
ncbi:hypothetical protein C8R47DRAFT_1243489 [Mycena vitilis]|nr:hypothetical protein C8R47DRAFT_1243489 [Mycena vitilis]